MKILKKLVYFLLFYCTTNYMSFGQLLNEEFDYDAGSLDTVSNFEWVRYSGSYNPVQVVDGNLSYPGYISSDIGRMIKMKADPTLSSMDYYRTFPPQNSGTIYTSFLLYLRNTDQMADSSDPKGRQFIGFYSSGKYFSKILAKRGPTYTTFRLGIQVNDYHPQVAWYDAVLNENQTYLIVFSYTFIPGDSNDIAALWVNPELSAIPPPPNVFQVSDTLDLVTSLSSIGIEQNRDFGKCSPNANIDGIRVATDWLDAPLPIQLGMMIASFVKNNSVLIEWETISEINNYGFYVEKYNNNLQQFVTIEESFQPGAGYTLQPRHYSWLDENVYEINPQYRLKQVDNDGLISYYGPIMLNPNSVRDSKKDLADYKLSQNYPNPFNPKTTIEFNLPVSTNVKLQIINMLGQQVALLVDREMNAGHHMIVFDGTDLPSGVYYYKLNTKNFVDVKKMILTK